MTDEGLSQQAYRTFRAEVAAADQLPTRAQRLDAITAAYERLCAVAEAPFQALRRVIISL